MTWRARNGNGGHGRTTVARVAVPLSRPPIKPAPSAAPISRNGADGSESLSLKRNAPSPAPAKSNYHWTTPELLRASELAFDVELPAGSIAKLLRHEFGTARSAEAVRWALRKHFGWKGTPRGTPYTKKSRRKS